MYLNIDNQTYWINRSRSAYTSRANKEDVKIYKRSTWGRRQPDGYLYECLMTLQAEDGQVLRHPALVPKEINLAWLKQAGFVD